MKVNVYAIYDVKLSVYHAPVTAINDVGVRRHFAQIFANPKAPYFDYYEDYNIIEIGTFQDESGTLEPVEHRRVATGSEIADEARSLMKRRENPHE